MPRHHPKPLPTPGSGFCMRGGGGVERVWPWLQFPCVRGIEPLLSLATHKVGEKLCCGQRHRRVGIVGSSRPRGRGGQGLLVWAFVIRLVRIFQEFLDLLQVRDQG